MKILGKADHVEGRAISRGGDYIVQMSSEEWNAWRGLTGPAVDGEFPLTTALVEAFDQFRYAMTEAAKAMGQRLVPIAAEAVAATSRLGCNHAACEGRAMCCEVG